MRRATPRRVWWAAAIGGAVGVLLVLAVASGAAPASSACVDVGPSPTGQVLRVTVRLQFHPAKSDRDGRRYWDTNLKPWAQTIASDIQNTVWKREMQDSRGSRLRIRVIISTKRRSLPGYDQIDLVSGARARASGAQTVGHLGGSPVSGTWRVPETPAMYTRYIGHLLGLEDVASASPGHEHDIMRAPGDPAARFVARDLDRMFAGARACQRPKAPSPCRSTPLSILSWPKSDDAAVRWYVRAGAQVRSLFARMFSLAPTAREISQDLQTSVLSQGGQSSSELRYERLRNALWEVQAAAEPDWCRQLVLGLRGEQEWAYRYGHGGARAGSLADKAFKRFDLQSRTLASQLSRDSAGGLGVGGPDVGSVPFPHVPLASVGKSHG
jgi:hypothetical protein